MELIQQKLTSKISLPSFLLNCTALQSDIDFGSQPHILNLQRSLYSEAMAPLKNEALHNVFHNKFNSGQIHLELTMRGGKQFHTMSDYKWEQRYQLTKGHSLTLNNRAHSEALYSSLDIRYCLLNNMLH